MAVDIVTVAPPRGPWCSPRPIGLKCATAWLRISLRELPSDSMFSRMRLATSCQPISTVSAAGREPVSEAKPTATTQKMPVENSVNSSPLMTSAPPGVGVPEASA